MSRARASIPRDPTLAFAYVRVSTDEQAVHGASLDAQLLEIQRTRRPSFGLPDRARSRFATLRLRSAPP